MVNILDIFKNWEPFWYLMMGGGFYGLMNLIMYVVMGKR